MKKAVRSLYLSGDAEEARDELRLPYRVPPAQPFNLTLSQHVQRFNALERSLRRVKPLEALRGSHFLFDKTVVLFDDIVQIFHTPQMTI